MPKSSLFFALLGAALTLSACVSAKVDSQFVIPYDRPLESTLVIVRSAEPGGPFDTALSTALVEALEARGVSASATSVASDVPNSTVADGVDAGASTVLVLRLGDSEESVAAPGYNNPATGPGFGGPGGMGTNSRTQFAAALTDVEAGRVVWTARVVAKGANSSPEADARKAATQLVATLNEDGLLRDAN